MNLEIERMTINDLDKISNELYSDFDDFWSISVFKAELENPNTYYLIAKIENEIVGFGGICKILDEMQINYIATRKDKRNLGIASQILYKLISFTNSTDVNSITLEVNEKNLIAIKLYEKFGFKKIAYRKKYYNNIDTAILMQKNI